MKSFYPYHPIFLALSTCLLLVVAGCGDDPEDPCQGVEKKVLDFQIFERITNFGDVDTLIATDTVLAVTNVVFEANGDYDSYAWQIGDDPRVFTEKRVALRFLGDFGRVQVKLVATWQPSGCFPEETGADTVEKTLTLISRDRAPIIGTYRGSLRSNPNDVFDIQVNRVGIVGFSISNLPNGCEVTPGQIDVSAGFSALNFFVEALFNETCPMPRGWLLLQPNRRDVVIRFTTANPANPLSPNRIPDEFTGTRIN